MALKDRNRLMSGYRLPHDQSAQQRRDTHTEPFTPHIPERPQQTNMAVAHEAIRQRSLQRLDRHSYAHGRAPGMEGTVYRTPFESTVIYFRSRPCDVGDNR